MSDRVLFMYKPLSLSVVAALSTLPPAPVGALLLPQKPLALSSSWDCKSTANNDWLCRSNDDTDYNQPLEQVTKQRNFLSSQSTDSFQQDLSFNSPQHYEPARHSYEETYSSIPSPSPQRQLQTYSQRAYLQQPAPEPVELYQATEQINPTGYSQVPPAPSAESIGLNRILNSSHGSYVLQWLAAHSPKPLKDLQNYFPVLKEATIVQYQRNDKYWYVLLDGPFKNREHAMAALKTSPRSDMINKLYPRSRSVASIQKLNLIRPDDIATKPVYDRTAMVNEYELPAIPPQKTNNMFASITSAYPNIEQTTDYRSVYDQADVYSKYEQPKQPRMNNIQQEYSHQQPTYNTSQNVRRGLYSRPSVDIDYNVLESRGTPEFQKNSHSRINNSANREINSILDAASGSYTIQWLAGHNKESLERAKRRYAYLEDAQIIQYRKRNRDWFVLVTPPYSSSLLAKRALEQPAYARIATRLYPRVRSISSLRQLTKTDKRALTSSAQQSNPIQQSSPIQTMLAGPDNNYTIQWFAANKPEAINKMKQRFPELSSAVTVHYRRNQKDWYVLLQGQYDSSSEALSIIKSPVMKDAVRILHPWTRPVGSLKKLSIQES